MNLEGQRFGRLLAVESATQKDKRGKNVKYYGCLCDCGETTVSRQDRLRSGHTKSCGCYRREVTADRSTTHGMSHTGVYKRWQDMLIRCHQPADRDYADYGGRGIKVCARWRNSFLTFLKDMGVPPPGLQIDRINNDGNYTPSNCRWATRTNQARNRRNNRHIRFKGVTKTLAAWSEETGIDRGTIMMRLSRKWSVARALTAPLRGTG